MPESAILVDSGTFLVDRQRALEKLKRFQIPDPALFILPLIRAAVASDAQCVVIESSEEQAYVELQFNGRPFSQKELEDPYGGLFERTRPERIRNRYLAIGLLSALRLNPARIAVISGPGHQRRCLLAITSLDADIRISKSDTPRSARTTIRVMEYDAKSAATVYGFVHGGAIAEWCAMCPIPIRIFQKKLRALHSFGSGKVDSSTRLNINEGTVRGWMSVPEIGKGISIRAYTWGVLAETLDASAVTDLNSRPVFFDAFINDDGFTLNASQTALVRNRRYRGALEILNREVGLLILKVIEAQRREAANVGLQLEDPGLLREWRRVWETRNEDTRTIWDAVSRPLKRLLKRANRSTASSEEKLMLHPFIRNHLWLRDACRKLLSGHDRDQADDVKRALWNAPLFFDVAAGPLSLSEIDHERRRLGYAPYSTERLPARSTPPSRTIHIVWISSRADMEFLLRFFSNALRDVTPTVRKSDQLVDLEFKRPQAPAAETAPAQSKTSVRRRTVKTSKPLPPLRGKMDGGFQNNIPRNPPPNLPLRGGGSATKPSSQAATPHPNSIVSLLKDLFHHLKGRHGLKLTETGIRTIDLAAGSSGRDILPGFDEKSWRLNPNHQLARTVLESTLSAEAKRDYLASILYTAVNRKRSDVLDHDDVAFQEALADALTAGKTDDRRSLQ